MELNVGPVCVCNINAVRTNKIFLFCITEAVADIEGET